GSPQGNCTLAGARQSRASAEGPMTELAQLTRSCAAVRKRDGKPCQSKPVGADGFCAIHSPSRGLDPVEMGRNGGVASGEARRALSASARERLRRLADEDGGVWGRLKAACRDGPEAVDGGGRP